MNNQIEKVISEKKELRRQRVMDTRSYKILTKVAQWMDRYYIDPILGLVPGGWGDTISMLMIVPFIWFSLFVVRSIPLTLAVVYYALKDVVLGLIPFFLGDFLDIFNRSYRRNMQLIQGFIDGDKTITRNVNSKVWFFAGAILLCIVVIVLLVKLTVALFSTVLSWILTL